MLHILIASQATCFFSRLMRMLPPLLPARRRLPGCVTRFSCNKMAFEYATRSCRSIMLKYGIRVMFSPPKLLRGMNTHVNTLREIIPAVPIIFSLVRMERIVRISSSDLGIFVLVIACCFPRPTDTKSLFRSISLWHLACQLPNHGNFPKQREVNPAKRELCKGPHCGQTWCGSCPSAPYTVTDTAFAALHSPSRLPQADRSAQEAAALQLATKQLEDQVAILSLTLQDREEQLRVSQQQVWTRLSSNLSPPWCW